MATHFKLGEKVSCFIEFNYLKRRSQTSFLDAWARKDSSLWVPLLHSYILQSKNKQEVNMNKALYYVLDNMVILQVCVGYLQYDWYKYLLRLYYLLSCILYAEDSTNRTSPLSQGVYSIQMPTWDRYRDKYVHLHFLSLRNHLERAPEAFIMVLFETKYIL